MVSFSSYKYVFMTGIIALWSGAVADIPIGWVLCDGTNGTPDLRNRFIVGAGDTYAVDSFGGFTQHNHTGTTDEGSTKEEAINSAHEMFFSAYDHTHNFTTNNNSNLPPYWALAYIMKV